jgi:hypothetical protein
MERERIERMTDAAVWIFGGLAAALLVPPVRRKVVDLLEERLQGDIEPEGVAARAGAAAAKAALAEAGAQAARTIKDQLLGGG